MNSCDAEGASVPVSIGPVLPAADWKDKELMTVKWVSLWNSGAFYLLGKYS